MPILYVIARYLGVAGCIIVGMLGFYEGIPGAWRIPFLSEVPILGDLATGKVHSFAAEQVRIATAQQTAICNGRIEKLSSSAELAAALATLDRERALRRMADYAAAEADERAVISKRAEEAKAVERERLRAEADQDAELSRPNQRDREWQLKH